jgi:hypothetical protein
MGLFGVCGGRGKESLGTRDKGLGLLGWWGIQPGMALLT